jgi:hypothetical protein
MLTWTCFRSSFSINSLQNLYIWTVLICQRRTKNSFHLLPNPRLFSSLVSSPLAHNRVSQSCDNKLDICLRKDLFVDSRCRFVGSCKIMFSLRQYYIWLIYRVYRKRLIQLWHVIKHHMLHLSIYFFHTNKDQDFSGGLLPFL